MNTPKSSIESHKSYSYYPQVKNLFESLSISEDVKEEIYKEFSNIAKIVYENPQGISNSDIIRQMKMGETHRDCFKIKNGFERHILDQYFNFIQKYPDGEKIWRLLSAYYIPSQS